MLEVYMIICILLLASQIITLDDLSQFWDEIINIKDGTLTRTQYFGCMFIYSYAISIVSVFILSFAGVKLNGTRNLTYFLLYGLVYLIVTFIQISAFCRRMNDAGLTKWYTLVFLVPVIGNLLAFIIAMMPSGFGSPY